VFEQDIDEWITGYLSECVEEHNNLPRCPYALGVWKNQKVKLIQVESSDELFTQVDYAIRGWNDKRIEVCIINLAYAPSTEDLIGSRVMLNNIYGMWDYIIIDEQQCFNGRNYSMLLIHRFSEMQSAKHNLREQGYYQDR